MGRNLRPLGSSKVYIVIDEKQHEAQAGAIETADLVISGAGFVGSALALALSQAFHGEMRIIVVDPAIKSLQPQAKPDPRASALAAASINLLAALGVWEPVRPYAEPVRRIEITDSGLDDGLRPVLLTYDNMLPSGEAATSIVENARLEQSLLTSLARAAGVTTVGGVKIETFEACSARGIARLSDGRSIAAPLVVAAEGRKSSLRQAAGIKLVGWDYGQSGIVTTIEHDADHQGTALQHFLPAGPFAVLPLPGGRRSCLTWSETTENARLIMALDDAAFLVEVEKRLAGRRGAVKLAGPRQSWPLNLQIAREYAGDRLALAGDTAHGVHPIAGQGLNLGLRDVAALAEVIADAARLGQDIGSPHVLDRYTQWRRTDSAMSAATYDGLNKLFSNDWKILRTARDAGLGVVDRLPFVKQWLVSEAAGLTGTVPRLLEGHYL